MYDGRYSVIPYYVKVKEYNNADQRDLFEYTLKFSQSEVDTIIDHLWELGTASVDYYFFDDNCSYQLLSLLEVAKQEWNLTNRFPAYVIPIDTLRVVLEQPDALESVDYRMSMSGQQKIKWDLMSSAEHDLYFDVLDLKKSPESIESPLVAEALNLYFSMLQIKNQGQLAGSDADLSRRLLVKRSQLPVLPPEQKFEMPSRPDLAHDTLRSGFAQTWRNGESIQEFSVRFSLHDLLNSDDGYSPFTDLETMNTRLRYSQAKNVYLEELAILNVTALNPWHPLNKRLSYLASFGFTRSFDCNGCLVFGTTGGVGPAFYLGTKKILVFALALGQLQSHPDLSRGYTLGPGVQLGFVATPTNKLKFLMRGTYRPTSIPVALAMTDIQAGMGFQFSKDWEARFLGRKVLWDQREANETSLGLNYYF